MRLGSLFAGVGGFDLGFEQAGWETQWQVEIEPFARAVLATRFPKAQRFNDIRECGRANLGEVDCITAGVPCQDVSVAGKRAGLAGERTGLFYEFARILRELRPAWFVFENVPGLLSSNRGRDFAEVLRVLMVECGYGVGWRVLDSRYFGVAQRRRRVFIVGSLGRPCPAAVLFESAGGRRDIAKGQEAGQRATRRADGSLAGAVAARDWKGADNIYAEEGKLVASTISSRIQGGSNQWAPYNEADNLVATLNSGGNAGGFRTEPGEPIVAFHENIGGNVAGADHARAWRRGASHSYQFVQSSEYGVQQYDTAGNLRSGRQSCGEYALFDERAPIDPDGVRDFAGLPAGLDSARYRALGNAVTTQVARWLGMRIAAIEAGGGS